MEDSRYESNLFFIKPESKVENKSEVILSSESVNNLFEKARKIRNPHIKPVVVTEYIHEDWVYFDKEGLDECTDEIINLASQLHEDLLTKDVGANIEFAYYRKDTPRENVRKPYEKWNSKNTQGTWTNDGETRNKLLALINAIGLGRLTITSSQLRANPQEPIRFIIDQERYQEFYGKNKPLIHKVK